MPSAANETEDWRGLTPPELIKYLAHQPATIQPQIQETSQTTTFNGKDHTKVKIQYKAYIGSTEIHLTYEKHEQPDDIRIVISKLKDEQFKWKSLYEHIQKFSAPNSTIIHIDKIPDICKYTKTDIPPN